MYGRNIAQVIPRWRVRVVTLDLWACDMLVQCEEAHCLQRVPVHLFQLHQDKHLAERLAAEEFETHRLNRIDRTAQSPLGSSRKGSLAWQGLLPIDSEDEEFQLSLALNRQLREEDEKYLFRQVQVHLPLRAFSMLRTPRLE